MKVIKTFSKVGISRWYEIPGENNKYINKNLEVRSGCSCDITKTLKYEERLNYWESVKEEMLRLKE